MMKLPLLYEDIIKKLYLQKYTELEHQISV